MSKGKTGLIVLTVLAAMFFLFVAILFGSSQKRQAVIDRNAGLNDRLDLFTETDLRIYWIGEPYKELERLSSDIIVVPSETASKDNLPIKGPSFHATEYNSEGTLVAENIPIEYPRYMIIIITGTPQFTEDGKAALLDAVANNGVPVLAIGDDAANALAGILSYKRFHTGSGSSLYYCLGKGYKENPIPEDAVISGGMDLAELIPDLISLAMTDYEPKI